MKTLIVFSLLFSLNSSAKAKAADHTDCTHCGTALRGDPSKAITGDVAKIARAVAEVDDRPNWLKGMSSNICTAINHGDKIVEAVDEIIKLNIEEVDGISSPNPDQVANFWNRYVEDMTCGTGDEKVHVMKHSLDQNLAFYSLFKKYLDQKIQRKLVDKSIRIDVNFLTDGQTVLDFVDSQIAKYEKMNDQLVDNDLDETILKMKRTRKLLVRRFNAKLSTELDSDLFAKR